MECMHPCALAARDNSNGPVATAIGTALRSEGAFTVTGQLQRWHSLASPSRGNPEWDVTYWKMQEGHMTQVPPAVYRWDFSLPIYTDGSCLYPALPRLASSGEAAVQQDRNWCGALAVLVAAPHGFPQSAAIG